MGNSSSNQINNAFSTAGEKIKNDLNIDNGIAILNNTIDNNVNKINDLTNKITSDLNNQSNLLQKSFTITKIIYLIYIVIYSII